MKSSMKICSMKNKGVTGFFEEIFLVMVVTIVFILLLSSILHFQLIRAEREKYVIIYEEVDKFAQSFIGYHKINRWYTVGLFDCHKLLTINYTIIKEDLQPKFNFSIIITDVGKYYMKYNFTYGDYTKSYYAYYRIVVNYPVNIWVNEEEIHPAILTVIGWK